MASFEYKYRVQVVHIDATIGGYMLDDSLFGLRGDSVTARVTKGINEPVFVPLNDESGVFGFHVSIDSFENKSCNILLLKDRIKLGRI
jgi:hypothetical protein